MSLQPEELTSAGFRLTEELDHDNLIPFVRKYLRKSTVTKKVYYTLNACFLVFLVGMIVWAVKNNLGATQIFDKVALGLAMTFLLVPIHEWIHGLAYQSQGAKNTSYGANLRKFYFVAYADKFVANRKAFRIVALAPLVVITVGLLVAMLFVPLKWQLSISAMLVLHTAMCSGDFGLLNYFDFHRDKEVVTYDDMEQKRTLFFMRESDEI